MNRHIVSFDYTLDFPPHVEPLASLLFLDLLDAPLAKKQLIGSFSINNPAKKNTVFNIWFFSPK